MVETDQSRKKNVANLRRMWENIQINVFFLCLDLLYWENITAQFYLIMYMWLFHESVVDSDICTFEYIFDIWVSFCKLMQMSACVLKMLH